MYRLQKKCNQKGHPPIWLTQVHRRGRGGAIWNVCTSWVTNSPWQRRKYETAQRMMAALTIFYIESNQDNPFEIVEVDDAQSPSQFHPRVVPVKHSKDWRHECGYEPVEICRNCVHCLSRENGMRSTWRYYCLREWKGCAYTPANDELWEHMESHDVEAFGKCRHVRVER